MWVWNKQVKLYTFWWFIHHHHKLMEIFRKDNTSHRMRTLSWHKIRKWVISLPFDLLEWVKIQYLTYILLMRLTCLICWSIHQIRLFIQTFSGECNYEEILRIRHITKTVTSQLREKSLTVDLFDIRLKSSISYRYLTIWSKTT